MARSANQFARAQTLSPCFRKTISKSNSSSSRYKRLINLTFTIRSLPLGYIESALTNMRHLSNIRTIRYHYVGYKWYSARSTDTIERKYTAIKLCFLMFLTWYTSTSKYSVNVVPICIDCDLLQWFIIALKHWRRHTAKIVCGHASLVVIRLFRWHRLNYNVLWSYAVWTSCRTGLT